MKTKFFILVVFLISIFVGCNSEKIETTVVDLNQTRKVESYGTIYQQGDYFLVLKIDGGFESNLPNAPLKGKWELNDEEKKLTLKSEKSGDGKGRSLKVEFTVLEMNDEKINLVDAEGQQFNFVSE